jgi:prophage maintenance system killer protein
MSTNNPLQKQLEQQRFTHAVTYVENSSGGLKKLSSNELSYLNKLLTASEAEPWRFNPIEVQIPSGKKLHFNVTNNPISRARELIGNANQMAGNQEAYQAASYLYSQLVLEHLFNDANRRTAVLATLWVLLEYHFEVDAEALLKIPIGDLRDPQAIENLAHQIKALHHD